MTLIEQVQTNEVLVELESSRDNIQLKISEAQAALDNAKAKQKTTGEYANAEWFSKTKTFIREQTIELHNISRKIKSIRYEQNKNNPRAMAFREVAKTILSEDIFSEIEERANSMV